MKRLLIIIILLVSVKCFGQDYYTLIAKSYFILNNGKQTKVNRVIALTYSREYSWLYIDGEKNTSFSNEQYTRDLIRGELHESYLSGESSTTLYGHYDIQIFHQKDNNIFEIASPITRTTFYAEHAQLYSENGKVLHNSYLTNWKELLEKEEQRKSSLEKEKQQKSLEKQKNNFIKDSIRRVQIKDSIKLVQLDSIKQLDAESKLESGNTYFSLDRDVEITLNSIVEEKVRMKKKEQINFLWKIIIDKEGVVTNALPDEKYVGGNLIKSYISEINNALINQRVKPYEAKNGKKYPFYSSVYINLGSVTEKEKKRPKSKLTDPLKILPMGSFLNLIK